MKTDLNMELMKNIADLYYNSNLTQSEIAHRYNISRPKVSRLLADARENGIVKFIRFRRRRQYECEAVICRGCD